MNICSFPVKKTLPVNPNHYDLALDILLLLGKYMQIQSKYFKGCSCVSTRSGRPLLNSSQRSSRILGSRTRHPSFCKSVFVDARVDGQYLQYAEDVYRSPGDALVLAMHILAGTAIGLHMGVQS